MIKYTVISYSCILVEGGEIMSKASREKKTKKVTATPRDSQSNQQNRQQQLGINTTKQA